MSQRNDIENVRHDINGLNKVAETLGYKSEFGTALENFFKDNPGACEAVIDWVLNEGCNSDGTAIDEDDDEECDEDNED
jgi:hypothetical protein